MYLAFLAVIVSCSFCSVICLKNLRFQAHLSYMSLYIVDGDEDVVQEKIDSHI